MSEVKEKKSKEVASKTVKPYHANPRKIEEEDLKRLAETMERLGDLSGIIVNTTTGELTGGNQRSKIVDINNAEV